MAGSGCRPESETYVGTPGKNDAINYQPGKQQVYAAIGKVPVQNDRAGRNIDPCGPDPACGLDTGM